MYDARQAIYRQILHHAVWLRSDLGSTSEVGHTFLYRPDNTIARRQDPALLETATGIRDEFGRLLGRSQGIPSRMLNGENPILAFRHLVDKSPTAEWAVFEGYAFNSAQEDAVLNEELAKAARAAGLWAVLSDPAAADQWNRKGYFLKQVERFYGPTAVPIGREWENPSVAELAMFAEERFQAGVEKVIFKTAGTGGYANLIVTSRDDLMGKIQNFMDNPMDASQKWVIAEEWRPWIMSPCTSFFSDGVGEPVWMEMCEQVLSPETAGFIGGRSFINLSVPDQEALVEFIRPLARQIYQDGVKGFIGFDVILCSPRAEDALRLPDSGWAVVFIEVNARLNGHNQERLFCALLANREGCTSTDLIHMRVGTKPVAGAANRQAVQSHFAQLLGDLAQPLTNQPLATNEVRFVLDVCNGQQASFYDAVLLVGRSSSVNQQTILAAVSRLQQNGALKI